MPSVIKCIVKGNKIEEVLLALEPFVLEPPVVQVITQKATSPAIKTKPAGGYVKAIHGYVEQLAKEGVKTVTTTQLRQLCIDLGGAGNNYSYPLKQLINEKRLKKTSQPLTYEIIK